MPLSPMVVSQMIVEGFIRSDGDWIVFDPSQYDGPRKRSDGFATLRELNNAGWSLVSLCPHPRLDLFIAVFTRQG